MLSQDKLEREKVDARNRLEAYCYGVRGHVEGGGGDEGDGPLSTKDKERALAAVTEALEWLEEGGHDAGEGGGCVSDAGPATVYVEHSMCTGRGGKSLDPE